MPAFGREASAGKACAIVPFSHRHERGLHRRRLPGCSRPLDGLPAQPSARPMDWTDPPLELTGRGPMIHGIFRRPEE
jgi:hypothetical protein